MVAVVVQLGHIAVYLVDSADAVTLERFVVPWVMNARLRVIFHAAMAMVVVLPDRAVLSVVERPSVMIRTGVVL